MEFAFAYQWPRSPPSGDVEDRHFLFTLDAWLSLDWALDLHVDRALHLACLDVLLPRHPAPTSLSWHGPTVPVQSPVDCGGLRWTNRHRSKRQLVQMASVSTNSKGAAEAGWCQNGGYRNTQSAYMILRTFQYSFIFVSLCMRVFA